MRDGSLRQRAGILGGGQLAKMLYEAALPLGLAVTVFSEADDAAASACPRVVRGEFDDDTALERFLAACDLVVFENEWVDTDALARVAVRFPNVVFAPTIATLAELRDKGKQKALVERLKIPTAPYVMRPAEEPIGHWLDAVLTRFPQGFVLKWAQKGYDGKGVLFVDAGSGNAAAKKRADALAFCGEAEKIGVGVFAEERVAFVREVAVLGCRSVTGDFVSYPLFGTEQEKGICLRIVGPASAVGIDPAREVEAAAIAAKVAESASLVGCFAIELFETADGRLLVNEMAPRVHNSGHVTQNAAATSQYENHWRAALGWPLGDVSMAPAYVMRNLLGPADAVLSGAETPRPIPGPGQHLHWYAKSETRPRRKVGHLNAVGKAGELTRLVSELEAAVSRWEKSVRERSDG